MLTCNIVASLCSWAYSFDQFGRQVFLRGGQDGIVDHLLHRSYHIDEPGHSERYIVRMACPPGENLDHPTLPRSLIRAESLLSLWRIFGTVATQRTPSECSDQTAWMRRLICVLGGRKFEVIPFAVHQLSDKSETWNINYYLFVISQCCE